MASYFPSKVFAINQVKYCDLFFDKSNFQNLSSGYYATYPDTTREKNIDLYIMNNIQNNPYEVCNSNYRSYNINFTDLYLSISIQPFYLLIYYEAEFAKYSSSAIPVYIKKISGLKNVNIYLPKNESYLIQIVNESGSTIIEKNISPEELENFLKKNLKTQQQ